jgi:hypothetical protein
MLTHYFSCSGGHGTDSTKGVMGHMMPNLPFLPPEGFVGHVVHFGSSGP